MARTKIVKYPVDSAYVINDLRNAYIVGFDPGESTGYVVLEVKTADLMFPGADITECVRVMDAGTINCHSAEGQGLAAHKHAGLNMFGENTGITQMLDVVDSFRTAAIIVEDFIPDFRKMDKARHTLSPVRLMAGFSYGLSLAWDEWDMWEGFGLGEERMFVSNRSMAKTTCTDDRLTKWKLNLPGESRHARDAMKHAVYFLKTAQNIYNQVESSAEIRHLAWPHLFKDPEITKVQRKPRVKTLGERI